MDTKVVLKYILETKNQNTNIHTSTNKTTNITCFAVALG